MRNRIYIIRWYNNVNMGPKELDYEILCSAWLDAVFFEFAKAFDSVSHKLLYKLAAYGITDDLLNCLDDFLHDRTQRVVLPNGVSSFKSVLSGVPQGSILDAFCFLIYIYIAI